MNRIEVKYQNILNLDIENGIIRFCNDVLEQLEITNWEVSILICDNSIIQDLNNKFRSNNSPTDVLSFTQDLVPIDNIVYAGDIIISIEKVKFHSITFNVPLDEELKRVLIHGILHLNGMDHITNSKEEKMLQFQEFILDKVLGENIV